MKNKLFYLYYIVLLIILVSRTNQDTPPIFLLRIVFLAAVVIPPMLSKFTNWLPVILTCFLTITSYGFAYSYMPTMMYIYAGIMLLFSIFISQKKNKHIPIPKILVVILIYMFIVDIITGTRIENVLYVIFIVTIFCIFIDKKDSFIVNKFSLAFAISSLVLSIFFIVNRDLFTVTYNYVQGMERSGWTDPNYFGTILGIGAVSSIIELIRNKKNSLIVRIIFIASIALSLPTIFISASRGAVLALIVSFVIILMFSQIKAKYKLFIVLIAVIFTFYLYNNSYFDLLIYRIENDDGGGSGRSEIWQNKLDFYLNRGNIMNWLIGFGNYGGLKIGLNETVGFHNDYLAFLVEYGLIGLILFLYMLAYPVLKMYKKSKERPFVWASLIYLALCCITLEPLSAATGRFTYWAFYMYIVLLAHSSNFSEKEIKL